MTPKGRIALFHGSRQPFELIERPLPDPPSGGVLLKLAHTSICGSDLHFWRGEDPRVDQLATHHGGIILGHEAVGRVARLGDGVRTDSLGTPLQVGDAVLHSYVGSCGACRSCRRETPHLCAAAIGSIARLPETPSVFTGAFADYYMIEPGSFFIRLPDGLEPADAIGANCAAAQVVHALQVGRTAADDHVVVQGAGGLGLYAVAAARHLLGADRIIAIDAVPSRLEAARALGASDTIDLGEVSEPKERVKRVKDLTDGGADIVLDVAGVKGTLAEGLPMLARGGRFLELGQITPDSEHVPYDAATLISRNLAVIGVALYDPRVLVRVAALLATLKDDPTLRHVMRDRRYPLEAIDRAFEETTSQPSVSRTVIDLVGAEI
jgi:threonine dehydrogenase-like Zn-dependent dehydrogenase